ncbi:hypothetical protein ALT785_320036 [Alteromonas infernus]
MTPHPTRYFRKWTALEFYVSTAFQRAMLNKMLLVPISHTPPIFKTKSKNINNSLFNIVMCISNIYYRGVVS